MKLNSGHLIGIYLAAAVTTGGLSFNLDYDRHNTRDNGIRAAISGVLWPAYWVYYVSKPLRPLEVNNGNTR